MPNPLAKARGNYCIQNWLKSLTKAGAIIIFKFSHRFNYYPTQ